MSSAGASILAVGYLLPLGYSLLSLRRPPDAGPNPWRATGLEWQTESPPPPHNFEETPVVVAGPYDYSPEALRIRRRPTVAPWLKAALTDPRGPVRRPGTAATGIESGHVDVPGDRGHVLWRTDCRLRGLSSHLATGICPGQPAPEALAGVHQYRGLTEQQSVDGAGGPVPPATRTAAT